MSRWFGLAVVFSIGLGLGVFGCADEEIGTPCEDEDDCSDGLECDEHDGQGTCQEPHDD